MPTVIHDAAALSAGERFHLLRVGKPASSNQILGEVDLDLSAPPRQQNLEIPVFSGFEFPARDALHLARERAAESGVDKILIVDPHGLLPLAPPSR